MTPAAPTTIPRAAAPARPPWIVLTGGPGGGKTAVLDAVRARLGDRLAYVPEAATIVFGGGFPRPTCDHELRCAQLAIYRVQEQLESLAEASGRPTLLDRSLVDGSAYWPAGREGLLAEVGAPLDAVLLRYDLVLHLEVPRAELGYDRTNPVRTEDAGEASRIDRRIVASWEGHPNLVLVPSTPRFETKLEDCLARITSFLDRAPIRPSPAPSEEKLR